MPRLPGKRHIVLAAASCAVVAITAIGVPSSGAALAPHKRGLLQKQFRLKTGAAHDLARGPSSISTAPVPIDPPMRVANALSTFGPKVFPKVFAGVSFEPDGTTVLVHLTSLDPSIKQDFESQAALAAPEVAVDFALSSHSTSDVESVHTEVGAAVGELQEEGTTILSYGPDVDTGLEQIEVLNLTPTKLAQLDAMFGANNIDVIDGSESEIPSAASGSRVNDGSPWNGSDLISVKENGSPFMECSLGYGFQFASGGVRSTTDGHCSYFYEDAPNDQWTVRNTYDGGPETGYIGTLLSTDPYTQPDASHKMDISIIGDTPGDRIWRGSIGGAWLDNVQSDTFNYNGEPGMCTDGALSGEVCSDLTINKPDYCQLFQLTTTQSYTACHIYRMACTNNCNAVTHGDSGGPVWHKSGGDVYAAGLIEGFEPDHDTVYFTDIEDFLTFENHATICSVTTPCPS